MIRYVGESTITDHIDGGLRSHLNVRVPDHGEEERHKSGICLYVYNVSSRVY